VAFEIEITAEADKQLQWLSVRDQRTLEEAIGTRLREDPTTPTNAIKAMRPNPRAQFELRVGNLRAMYNVADGRVAIVVVGKKNREKLLVCGEEYHDHQDDPVEPIRGKLGEDAE
jgi:mRNA-degrading endonuclease RelE of RelBE toxin-antitoxin system